MDQSAGGAVAALSQFHGVRPARQLWKPRPRRVPERAALALRGREGVSAETRPPPGGRPAGRRGRRGRGPGRPSAPEPGSPPATQRLAELRGAEGGVFPEPGCREGTGDPRSWSGITCPPDAVKTMKDKTSAPTLDELIIPPGRTLSERGSLGFQQTHQNHLVS